ncbi:site-specific integrase [Candidatus Saccharibacteria bacterium]|nr:site-specific integrase [Candidatus Saccharibacteria bacterium]
MLYRKVTFLTVMELWREKAESNGFSPKTVRNTESFTKMLGRFVPLEGRLKRFTAEEYELVVAQMKRAGYAPETVRDLIATLRKLLNLAFRKRLVRRNVLDKTESLRMRERYEARVIPFADFEKIVAWTERREYRFLFTLLYYSGVRIGEALALTPADFRLSGGILRVKISKSYLYDFKVLKTTKNGKIREIPLSKAVFGEFLDLIEAREQSAQIFQFSPQAARAALHKICEELGLPKYRLHEFRHTFVSNLMRAGVPIAVVAEVSGDTQATVLRRYSHIFPNDEEMIVDALCASCYAAKPT